MAAANSGPRTISGPMTFSASGENVMRGLRSQRTQGTATTHAFERRGTPHPLPPPLAGRGSRTSRSARLACAGASVRMPSRSASHLVDVFDGDVAAIAEIGDQDGEPHGGFGSGDG